ncbi:MAG: DNA polymerase III subunit delta [Parcubacteria group bacterium]|nr:DNA polymerase III subunit delta [Parcubacteria group bacterium]
MLYFLYGEDSYRARQKLNEIINEYQKKNSGLLNFSRFDLEEDLINKIFDESRNANLLGKKLTVVENISFLPKNFEEKFIKTLDFLKNDKEIIIVLFEPGKLDAKKKIFKELKEIAKNQEFKKITGRELAVWTKKEIKAEGGEIDSQVLDLLIGLFQNSWEIASEIKKLVNYSPKISEESILTLSQNRAEVSVFKFIDSILAKQKYQSLILLEKILKNGESELNVLGLLAYYFRNLLRLNSLNQKGLSGREAAAAAGLHPYAASKMTAAFRFFGLQELKKFYSQILKIEFLIKSGQIDPRDGLWQFLLDV